MRIKKKLLILDKLSCASAKKMKNFVFHFVLRSTCINFARSKNLVYA